jgi:hypothetical protein
VQLLFEQKRPAELLVREDDNDNIENFHPGGKDGKSTGSFCAKLCLSRTHHSVPVA